MSEYIEAGNERLHYLKYGEGKRLLLCFHGYANNASVFAAFEPYLRRDFTIISIDLPHHGKTKWTKGKQLRRSDLSGLMEALMLRFKVEKLSLMGYSMGGRVCLTIVEMMPEKIENVLLIASDGLVFSPLYFAATRTFFGKRLFRSFLGNPRKYMKYIEWMRSRKWIDESRYKFAMYYLGSETDRSFLLNVWSDMSMIVPNMKKLRSAVRDHQIPVYIFMGHFDRVIPLRHAQRFMKGLESVKLFVVEKGHRVFDSDTIPQMAKCLIDHTC